MTIIFLVWLAQLEIFMGTLRKFLSYFETDSAEINSPINELNARIINQLTTASLQTGTIFPNIFFFHPRKTLIGSTIVK